MSTEKLWVEFHTRHGLLRCADWSSLFVHLLCAILVEIIRVQ